MPLGRDYAGQDCAIARALEVIGERWTMLVLRDCFYGVRRFADLRAHLDIPRAVLANRLDGLVDAGVLERQPYAPGRDEYVLTEAGIALWPTLYALWRWGDRYATPADGAHRAFAHAACPTGPAGDVDAAGRCPACGAVPPPGELEVRPVVVSTRRDDPVSLALRRPHRLLTPVP